VTRIGLLSDTHGYLDPRVFEYFKDADEIWHAGDIGSDVVEPLVQFKPLKAVYGNIDGGSIRNQFPLDNRFVCDGLDVWITHIGGYPGNYDQRVRPLIRQNPPGLFVCGHSHILKVMPDKQLNLLHINPGAAGKSGFHIMRTIVRFGIDKGIVKDLEVIELGKRNAIT
jgi:putative phosphoesterase